jgi:[histone H3]-N6,N6-dimethyl-L-lysine4 FAD-dependent demethylase
VLNKVALLFPSRWWGEDDTFGHVADASDEPGWCYLWYCFPDLAGGPLLAALVSGHAALDLEAMSDEAVINRVMRRLRRYHPDANVPNPVSTAITRWGRDPHMRGSYSSVPPGCAGAADYDELARNVGGRVFFAGEATTSRYPAQMHGAFDTGLREVRTP